MLRTLSDLEKDWKEEYGVLLPFVNGKIALCNDLRKISIEWIKELENRHTTFYGNNICKPDCQSCPKIVWIKHFFNITEEDLK
jgi:hypothetical protein